MRCDCGYDFKDQGMDVSLLPGRPRFASLEERRVKGLWLLILGLVLLAVGFVGIFFFLSSHTRVVWFGPFIAGLALVFRGLTLRYPPRS